MRAAACAVVALVLLMPVAAAQIPSTSPARPAVAWVQLSAPHLLRPEPGVAVDVPVHVRGTLQCDPGTAPPQEEAVYMTEGKGFGFGTDGKNVQIWDFAPDQVKVGWSDQGDGRFTIDKDVHFTMTSEGRPTRDVDMPAIWSLVDHGRMQGACTAASYDVDYGTAQAAMLASPAAPASSTTGHASPEAGALLIFVVAALAVLMRRRL